MKKVSFKEESQLLCLEITSLASPELPSPKDSKKRWYTDEDYAYFAVERNYCSFMMRKTGKDTLLDFVLPCGDDALINTKTLQSQLFEWEELEICRGLEIKIIRSHRYQ